MTIKEINDLIESDYHNESINEVNDGWFPLMKYDEEYGFKRSLEGIKAISIGLNPSLTNEFAKHIHHDILGIEKQFDFKSQLKYGQERYDHYVRNKSNVTKKLVEYQSKLKYDIQNQIPYFNHLSLFFNEIDPEINFKDHVFHYDFCQLRHTDSKDMTNLMIKKYDTFVKHLKLVIDVINPELIFIFNASLARLLKDNDFFTSQTLDKEKGCYFLKHNLQSKTKIILANQLSGGATSTVYRDLIVWNVQRILNTF